MGKLYYALVTTAVRPEFPTYCGKTRLHHELLTVTKQKVRSLAVNGSGGIDETQASFAAGWFSRAAGLPRAMVQKSPVEAATAGRRLWVSHHVPVVRTN